jgi:IstB-like ATP binding protein
VLNSERLTGATLDWLTHRCRITETKGESYRLQEAKAWTSRRAHPITKPIDENPNPELTCHDGPAAVFDHRSLEARSIDRHRESHSH